jgi:hypothetical protein
VVECHLAKVDVEGSNPFSRSEKSGVFGSLGRVGRRPIVPQRPAKTRSGTTTSSRDSSRIGTGGGAKVLAASEAIQLWKPLAHELTVAVLKDHLVTLDGLVGGFDCRPFAFDFEMRSVGLGPD